MIYCMSDLHGRYDLFKEMLEKIHFSDEDTLYILGDIVDRGPEPIEILFDVMKRPNVYCLLGNHEVMALAVLKDLDASGIDKVDMGAMIDWQFNGGASTLNEFYLLSAEERRDLLEFLDEFTLYETLDVNDNSFILTHAGLGNFNINKKMSDYSLYDLTWERPGLKDRYFPDDHIYCVFGHTPVQLYNNKAEVIFGDHKIDIDCGASFPGGQLACLCLNDFSVQYV